MNNEQSLAFHLHTSLSHRHAIRFGGESESRANQSRFHLMKATGLGWV